MTSTAFAHRPALGLMFVALFLAGLVFAVMDGPSKWWAITYTVHFFIFSFGVGFGLHRIIAHQAAVPSRFVLGLSALVGSLAQVGSPVSWRTVHILHHRYSDGDHDPQSPARVGWRVILGFTAALTKESMVESLLAARSLRDPILILIHKYYYLISVAYWLLCYLCFGHEGLVYLAAIPVGLSILTLGLLNYFAHSNFGYQNFVSGERSCNVWWLWPLAFGENWHNNHHHAPSSLSARSRIFEIDLIYPFFLLTKPAHAQESSRHFARRTP